MTAPFALMTHVLIPSGSKSIQHQNKRAQLTPLLQCRLSAPDARIFIFQAYLMLAVE